MADGKSPPSGAAAPQGTVESTVAALSFAVGLLLIAVPAAYWTFPVVTPDSSVLPDHHQSAESFLFLLTFAILIPAGCLMFVLAGRNRKFGTLLVRGAGYPWVLLASVSLAVVLMRLLSESGNIGALKASFALGILWVLSAAALTFLVRGTGQPALAARRRVLVALSVVLGAGALATLVSWSSVNLPVLALLLAAAALVAWRFGASSPKYLSRPWGFLVDAGILLLIMISVPDLHILGGFNESRTFEDAYNDTIIQFHQSLFMGAANQVQGGSHLLVDVVSQYGVAVIYFIALWFELVPMNYGTLGLLDGSLIAVTFAAGYAILRTSGVSRLLSAIALTVGVIALVYGQYYPVGALLQHGALRFSLPMALILAEVVAARSPRFASWARIAALAVLGLSSIWALEAFLYTTAAWLGMVAFRIWAADRKRGRLAVTEMARAAVAILTVHLLFALGTLVFAGSWPDWGMYFAYLREFLGGEVGTITYDFTPFAPAMALGLVYAASALGLLANLILRRDRVRENSTVFLAITGLTLYGIALYSYLVNRSLDHILPAVALPGLLLAALWVHFGIRELGTSRSRSGLILAVGMVSALLLATAWGPAGERFNRTPLGSLVPGGPSLTERLDRLRNMPPLYPQTNSGVGLLDRYMPPPAHAYVLTSPDIGTEILVSAGRPNPFGFPDAKEASWVSGPHLDALDQAVAGMSAGDRLLVDQKALEAMRRLRVDPDLDIDALTVETGIQEIQARALSEIDRRFRLRQIATGDDGLKVVELVPEPAPQP